MKRKETPVPKESELGLSEDEVTRLAAIIVPMEACNQVYESDEIALALIRLVAGVAGKGHRQEAAFLVTRGCFNRTLAHNRLLDEFTLEGLLFKSEQLPSEPERVRELEEARRRAR